MDFTSLRAVVADDMTIQRQQAVRILAELGIAVIAACRNGKEAVDACAAEKPDFVLLDLSMPVLTGIQAAEIIARDKTAKHVVIVSSQAQSGIIDPLRHLGCKFCLKPYDHRQLKQLITELCEASP
jgi:response regulator NasT